MEADQIKALKKKRNSLYVLKNRFGKDKQRVKELEEQMGVINKRIGELRFSRLTEHRSQSSQLTADFEDAKDKLVAAFQGITKLHTDLADAGSESDGEGSPAR